MDQLPQIKNIKTESTNSTTTTKMEFPNENKITSIKKESDYFVHSEIDIKTEEQEDENKSQVTESTFYVMCPNYNVQTQNDESIVKSERMDSFDESTQDPLDVSSQTKVAYKDDDQHCTSETTHKIEEKYGLASEKKCKKLKSGDSQDIKLQFVKKRVIRKKQNLLCKECNKIFAWKGDLDKHIRIHTGDKPFTCTVCQASFNQKGSLKIHFLIHTDKKPHTCDVCQRSFKHRCALTNHKLIHIGLKPFLCSVCNKAFARRDSLVLHEKLHTGNKPFTCEFCSKTFALKVHLKRHRYLHTGNRPFSCDNCPKSFITKTSLNYHIRTCKQQGTVQE